MADPTDDLTAVTAQVVAAYTGNNAVPAGDLPGVIRLVHAAFRNLGQPQEPVEPDQQPAVPIKKSVSPDTIVCLECGYRGKMLRRHLDTAHDLTPDDYRRKWRLPADYPMVAPNYAAQRSEMATQLGLGQKGMAARRSAQEPAQEAPAKGRKRAKPKGE